MKNYSTADAMKSFRDKTRREKRLARIVAVAVEVRCPYCAEPQPSPDNGYYMWDPSQVSAAQGPRTCISCDEPFTIHAQSRVSVAGS
jgi:hypothetical protein